MNDLKRYRNAAGLRGIGSGTEIDMGKALAARLLSLIRAGKSTVEQALKDSQLAVGRAVKQAGYQK